MSEIQTTVHRVLCFTCIKEVEGKPRTFYFTANDSPVTLNGIQYVPLSQFDQEVWGLLKEHS